MIVSGGGRAGAFAALRPPAAQAFMQAGLRAPALKAQLISPDGVIKGSQLL